MDTLYGYIIWNIIWIHYMDTLYGYIRNVSTRQLLLLPLLGHITFNSYTIVYEWTVYICTVRYYDYSFAFC